MQDPPVLPELTLTVHRQDLSFYTTLLQSGVEIKGSSGETMAHFLNRLPGFTNDYVADTIQTIFLNGTAVDDLTTPLGSDGPVLAISAAMPGLAGAILRRNSFHAGLRTATDTAATTVKASEPTFVTLKLFNSIAMERGKELFEMGVCIHTLTFTRFLSRRAHLIKRIIQIQLENTLINKEDVTLLLAGIKKITLRITTTHD